MLPHPQNLVNHNLSSNFLVVFSFTHSHIHSTQNVHPLTKPPLVWQELHHRNPTNKSAWEHHMALTSLKHIETQSLFCTGLHESNCGSIKCLGTLSMKVLNCPYPGLAQNTAPRSRCLPQSACVWNLPETSLIAKSSGKFEPKRFHHGVWILNGIRSCEEADQNVQLHRAVRTGWSRGPAQKRFHSSYNSTIVNAPAGGLVGAVSLTAVSCGLNTVPVYWSCYVEKLSNTNFFIKAMSLIEFVDNHQKVSCYWSHSIEISISWPSPRFHWRRWRLCWARTLVLRAVGCFAGYPGQYHWGRVFLDLGMLSPNILK